MYLGNRYWIMARPAVDNYLEYSVLNGVKELNQVLILLYDRKYSIYSQILF